MRAFRSCEQCGQDYRPTYKDQRTCGRACGAVLSKATKSLRPKAEVVIASRIHINTCVECSVLFIAQRPRRICSRSCELAKGRRRSKDAFVSQAIPTTKSCADCGENYTTPTAANCGVCKRCQKRRYGKSDRKRARYHGVGYEPISRLKVYQRDGWKCGLCGKAVDRRVMAPHPMSVSLDHVVPLSMGGDHVYANVQCAHFGCNSLKGAGGGQQLALVG